jgi:putative tryptophan/tyrosine transport system substrate-binding protein
MKKTLMIILSALVFLGLDPLGVLFASGLKTTIAIINSKAIAPYNDAISGFKEQLEKGGYEANFGYYDFKEDAKKELIGAITSLRPDIIFAVGTEAALFAKEDAGEFPVVFSMVINPTASKIVDSLEAPGNNLTGVSLDIPIETQFKKLKEFLPDLKKIGMLYDANKNKLLEEAGIAANKLGLDLYAKPVYSEAEVIDAVEEVLKESDCLWAGIDPLVYNQQSAKYILMATFRHKKPFMAFSYNYVKAGALFALECDYRDIGRQSAQIAVRILRGEKPDNIPVEPPRKIRMAINQKIAEVINMIIPSAISKEADKVYGVE